MILDLNSSTPWCPQQMGSSHLWGWKCSSCQAFDSHRILPTLQTGGQHISSIKISSSPANHLQIPFPSLFWAWWLDISIYINIQIISPRFFLSHKQILRPAAICSSLKYKWALSKLTAVVGALHAPPQGSWLHPPIRGPWNAHHLLLRRPNCSKLLVSTEWLLLMVPRETGKHFGLGCSMGVPGHKGGMQNHSKTHRKQWRNEQQTHGRANCFLFDGRL